MAKREGTVMGIFDLLFFTIGLNLFVDICLSTANLTKEV